MDKQQAARVAFEDEMDKLGWKTDHHVSHYGQQITYTHHRVQEMWLLWQAARSALMPALVEARDTLLNDEIYMTHLRDEEECNLLSVLDKCDCGFIEHWSKRKQAIAHINAIIGDKKMTWNGTGAFLRQYEQLMHENRVGLPWIIVTKYKGSFGQAIEDIEHLDFNGYTKPTMDKGKRFIFSLQQDFKDVAMVRCKGQIARQYALDKVNKILDDRGIK